MATPETQPLLTSNVTENGNVRSQEEDTVKRSIGWKSAFILIISRVIGSGIFAMPGTILQNAGSPGLALVLWIAGALIAWCGLSIDMEYGCMLPRSGGMKLYLEFTYPWPRFLASTMIAVSAVLLGFTASNCIVFAKYVLFAFGRTPQDFDTKVLAAGLLTVITIIHGCFYRTGVWLQNTLGWLKIAMICIMIVTGIGVILIGHETSTLQYNSLFDDSNWDLNNLTTSLFKIFYSYAGLNNINNVMSEVKSPVKTLRSVAPAALLTACLLYLLINVAYLAVVPLDRAKQSRELIAALFFERLGFGKLLLPLAIALSAAGNVMVVTFSLARLNQEIARQGFLPFPHVLGSSKPFNAPLGGLIVHYIPSFLVIVLPPSSTVYAFIADVEGYAGQFFAFSLAVGLLVLRYRRPELSRPFKAWIPSVLVRILLSILLILAPMFPAAAKDATHFHATYALVGLSILLFGIIYWYVWTICLPHIRGYRLESERLVGKDGVTISRLVRRSLPEG